MICLINTQVQKLRVMVVQNGLYRVILHVTNINNTEKIVETGG